MAKHIHARRSFTEEESERLRDVVREYMRKNELTQTEMAKLIGIHQPSLSSFLKENYGAGPQMARGIAETIGTTVDVLLGWKTSSEGRPVASTMHEDPVKERGNAIALGREAGVSDMAISRLRKITGASYKDTFSWLERLVRIERDLRDEAPRPSPPRIKVR